MGSQTRRADRTHGLDLHFGGREARSSMEPDSNLARLSFAACTAALLFLSATAFRRRSTSIGTAHLVFLVTATAWTGAYLAVLQGWFDGSRASALTGPLYLLLAAASVRLATLCARDVRVLPVRDEVFIWLPAVAIWLTDSRTGLCLWAAFTFGLASARWAQLPLRSWHGFRTARTASSIAALLPGLTPFAWLCGAPEDLLAIVAGPLVVAQGMVLFYALSRLGLSSSDQVHHSTVIEAMSDGVLVVDLQGRLVDFNQAAREILEIQHLVRTRPDLSEALAHHPDLIELFNGAIDGRSIYTPECLARAGLPRTFDLQLSALYDAMGAIESRVVVLRDITERVEIEEENRRQARHVRLVHEVSAAVHEARTIDAGLRAALVLIAETMGYPVGQFLESREEGGVSKFRRVGVFFVEAEVPGEFEIGQALAEPEGALEIESEADASSVTARADVGAAAVGALGRDLATFGYQTALTVPVLIGPRLYGLFEFYHQTVREIDGTTTEILEHVGDLAGRAIERKLAEEKIRRLAYRDDLTGLPNRQRFNQLLAGAVANAGRSHRRMALLFMDLDGFKQVNDTLGHEAGDVLLAEVASRFSRAVRAGDHIGCTSEASLEPPVSRLGGDEFTVLLTEINQPPDAALVAERLLSTLESPIELDGQELFIGTSIGIAIYPDDGDEADRLLRNADAAMYFAKGRGRNGYQFYSEEMNTNRARRLELEARLRGAVERGDLALHYQPLLDAETGRIVAAGSAAPMGRRRVGLRLPRRLHSRRRGDRTDRFDRRLGVPDGLRAAACLGRGGARVDPGRGERLWTSDPRARHGRDGAHSARGERRVGGSHGTRAHRVDDHAGRSPDGADGSRAQADRPGAVPR